MFNFHCLTYLNALKCVMLYLRVYPQRPTCRVHFKHSSECGTLTFATILPTKFDQHKNKKKKKKIINKIKNQEKQKLNRSQMKRLLFSIFKI